MSRPSDEHECPFCGLGDDETLGRVVRSRHALASLLPGEQDRPMSERPCHAHDLCVASAAQRILGITVKMGD